MVYDKVCNIIAAQMNIDAKNISPESNLFEDLLLDSLELVETMVLIEHEFEIDVPDEAVPNLLTVQDIVSYLEENAKQ